MKKIDNYKRKTLRLFTQSLLYVNPLGNKPGNLDSEMIGFLIEINSIQGMVTLQSCIGHQPLDPKWELVNPEFPTDGLIWIAFESEKLPQKCPLEYQRLNEDYLDFPTYEFRFRYHDFSKLEEFIEWLREIKNGD